MSDLKITVNKLDHVWSFWRRDRRVSGSLGHFPSTLRGAIECRHRRVIQYSATIKVDRDFHLCTNFQTKSTVMTNLILLSCLSPLLPYTF